MKAENWKNIKDVLLEVLNLDASERRKYLERAEISAETREEVQSLLAFENESEDLMRLSAVEFSKDFFESEDVGRNVLIGQRVGVYEIARELGYGGMGAVYLAERTDGKFKQKVALKLLKREMNTAALRQRFRQEREILASLDHPNIARLLDAGTTDDQIPFIAMEYVEGLPIDDYCNKYDLDLSGRLNLFRTVCAAVNFAHRNLIVHRDLKPSNILVTADGTPKLLDFGISKILSGETENINTATITRLGVMTPGYASPEQLRSESVTTATDIYSLGVILYELLSGHRPFENKEADLKEIYRAVIDTDPPPPSVAAITISKSLSEKSNAVTEIKFSEDGSPPNKNSSRTEPNDFRHTAPQTIGIKSQFLRGDLDNIVLKALKKEPERRYSSAENFAEDIKRHLDGLPVTARPDTFAYRAEKFIKRNSFSVIAAALILLAIITGIIATLWQARIAQAERARAEKRFNDVRTLANSFLFEFSPLVENLPGSTPARKLLVERALEYLDNLSQETGDDVELRRELARAYEKVGSVQGNPYNPNIGDTKGALASYEKARIIQEKLLEIEPDSLKAQSDLANIYALLGGIHSNGADYDKGQIFYDKSLALREKIVEQKPQDFEERTKLAGIVRSRGLIPYFEGDNKKAIEYYSRAGDIYEQLRRERSGDDKIAEEYAYTFVLIGEAQGWDGEPEIGGESIQKGLDMLLPLSEKHPNDRSIQRSLNLAYSKRGESYEDTEIYDKAVISYGKALEIAQNALKADPQSFQSKRDVALANKKLAGALDYAGKSQESLEKFAVALGIFQEMSAADPSNNEYPYDVANTRFSIGETYLTLKNYDSALETFLKAKEEFQKVLAINPDNIYAVRMSSFNLNRVGKSYVALSEKGNRREFLEQALEHLHAALNNLKKLKSEGKLSETDNKEITDMEKEIAAVESKTNK